MKSPESVVGYRPAKKATLGDVIDELDRRYAKRIAADAVADKLKNEENLVRDYLMGLTAEQDLNGAKGTSGASIAIIDTEVPQLKDWKVFFDFAKRKGNDDLLQASVSSPAWRERLKAGKSVPGVESFVRRSLRLNPSRKGRS